MNQLIANVKTAVVVRRRPTAAVAVNNEKFIMRNFFYNIFLLVSGLY